MRIPPVASLACTALFAAVLAAPSLAQSGSPSTPVPGQATSTALPTETHAGVSGLDAMTSTVFQEGQSSFSGIALRLRIKSGLLSPSVEIMPAVEYWQNVSRVTMFNLKTTRSDATLGCQLRWKMQREHWQPYFGGGLAVHFLSDKITSPELAQANQHHSTVRGGYSLLAGLSFPMTERLSNFVELQHHGVSHYRQLKFNTGLGWNF